MKNVYHFQLFSTFLTHSKHSISFGVFWDVYVTRFAQSLQGSW